MRMTLLGLVFLAACGSSGRSTLDASADGDIPDDGPRGGVCGGLLPRHCSATEYCDYPDNGCGVGDQQGTCKPKPTACPLTAGLIATPTCACDGRVYNSECDANEHGMDLNAHGSCDVPKERFACGYRQCLLPNQYCKREPQVGAAETFTCVGLPTCPGVPTCACLANQPCGKNCTGDATVGLTLTCSL
jgi:hypothetical protein